ncbi:MAG: hypothetical protein RO257_10510 [Candidatus Kapabacteria bacterium]|nr:hypothetical protein [Candidatus Kapabacteria bacterium]
MKTLILMFVIFLINCDLAVTQTKITTVQGNNIIGFIVNDSDNEVVLQNLSDIIVTIQTSQIVKKDEIVIKLTIKSGVQLEGNIRSIRKYDFDFISIDGTKSVMTFESIEGYFSDDKDVMSILKTKFRNNQYSKTENKLDISKGFKKIGLAVGTPGGINIVFGSNNSKACFGISAGLTGVQLNFGANVFHKASFEFNILFNISYMQYQYKEGPYYTKNKFGIAFGPLLELYLYGFHAHVGEAVWLDNSSKIPLYLQVGIVHRYGN